MHDSEQDPVAYSTLPFKVQTTELDYKLHTDCTVFLAAQHSHMASGDYGKRKRSAASSFNKNTHL